MGRHAVALWLQLLGQPFAFGFSLHPPPLPPLTLACSTSWKNHIFVEGLLSEIYTHCTHVYTSVHQVQAALVKVILLEGEVFCRAGRK